MTKELLLEEHPWLESSVPYTVAELREFVYRVERVKRQLISSVLAAQGDAVSLSGIINHISILLQLPVVCFVYDKKKKLLASFDFKKFKASRNTGIKIKNRDGSVAIDFTEDSSVIDNQPELFGIYGTGFSLRVFSLNVREESLAADFLEVSTKRLPKKKIFSKSEKQEEYIKILLNGFLDFSEDSNEYGDTFVAQIRKKISEIVSSKNYTQPKKGRREITTLSENVDATKKFIENRLRDMQGKQHGLDRIYRRTAFAGRAIKSIGVDGDPSDYPNMLFSFRVYDRTEKEVRAKKSENGDMFDGYMHSVAFAIPHQQRLDIENYFREISQSYHGELYGEEWDFFSKDQQVENNIYNSFVRSLDKKFWSLISTDKGRAEVLDILCSRVGVNSTSMTDAVFYYGSSMYRMPFRRLGGLFRLHGLSSKITDCIDSEKDVLSIDEIHDEDLRNDAIRVVSFFYLSRMLGPRNLEQKKCWTRVSIFPIEVATAVVGSVSCISFEHKKLPEKSNISVDGRAWRQEFYFFSEVVGSAQRVLRQQYRDFQIDVICESFSELLHGFLVESCFKNNGVWDLRMLKAMEDRLNDVSRMISRICPWPAYIFRFIPLDLVDSSFNGMTVGDQFGVVVGNEKKWDVFRVQHDIPGFSEISRENQKSLLTKMDQRIKSTFDNFGSTIFHSAPNGVH